MTLTYPQTDLANYNGTVATIHTNLGDLTVKLFDDVAPKTVKNFIELALNKNQMGNIPSISYVCTTIFSTI